MSNLEINPAHSRQFRFSGILPTITRSNGVTASNNSGKKDDDPNSKIMCRVKITRHHCSDIDIAIISLKGIIDSLNKTKELEETIEKLLAEGVCQFIFDLSGLETTDSTFLGFFIKLVVATKEKDGGGVVILQPSERFKTAFELVGLKEHIPIANDLKSALKSFLPPESWWSRG
jgi:anti-anti-sigma factor